MSDTQAPAGVWRWLHIGDVKLPLWSGDVPALYEAKIVYDCGEGHDLHLDPARRHDVRAVETLCLAIRRALVEPDMWWDGNNEQPFDDPAQWAREAAELTVESGPQLERFHTAARLADRWCVIVPFEDTGRPGGVGYRVRTFYNRETAEAVLAEEKRQGELDLSGQAGALS
jgi:hypothetical protein